MAENSGDFEHDSIQDPESVVNYLEALANGFRTGRLLFCSGKKELILKPRNLVKFSVKASGKDGSSKITLRIAWKNGRRKLAGSDALVIESPSEQQDASQDDAESEDA